MNLLLHTKLTPRIYVANLRSTNAPIDALESCLRMEKHSPEMKTKGIKRLLYNVHQLSIVRKIYFRLKLKCCGKRNFVRAPHHPFKLKPLFCFQCTFFNLYSNIVLKFCCATSASNQKSLSLWKHTNAADESAEIVNDFVYFFYSFWFSSCHLVLCNFLCRFCGFDDFVSTLTLHPHRFSNWETMKM